MRTSFVTEAAFCWQAHVPKVVAAPSSHVLCANIRTRKFFLAAIKDSDVTIDQWQLEKLAMVATRVDLFTCLPGLSDDLRGKIWGKSFGRIEPALDAFFARLAPNARICVIPEGPYVLAKV